MSILELKFYKILVAWLVLSYPDLLVTSDPLNGFE